MLLPEGLKNVAKMLRGEKFGKAVQKRYAGWDTAFGKKIEKRQVVLKELEAYTLKNGEPKVQSGLQKMHLKCVIQPTNERNQKRI